MFEAYSIGVTLKLNNQISPAITLLATQFEKLETLTLSLSRSLAKISVDSAGLRGLTTAANSTNRAFERATLSAAAFHRNIQALSHAGLGGIGATPRMGLPPAGGGGGGGGGSRGPSGGFHGGNIHMGAGGLGLGTVGMSAGDWFWPLAASGAAVYAGSSLFQSAKEMDTERQRFKLLGMSERQNQEAFDFVSRMRVYGTTQTENMAAFREAQGVGRESGLPNSRALNFAKTAAPMLARLDALGMGLDEESRAALHQSNIALLRFDEQSGGLGSTETFNRLANIGYKLRQSSGGTIDFEQLRAATAKGGAYAQSMTDLGWAHAEPIIQELKGAAYGVGLTQAGNRMFGAMSRTPKNLTQEATRLGFWTDSRHKLSESDAQAFKDDFPQFIIDRVLPAYKRANLSLNDQIRENTILFGTTGARIANLVAKAAANGTIENAGTAFGIAKSVDQATLQLPKSLSGQQLEFEAAWKDFKINWGTTALPFFTGILKVGAQILRPIPGSSTSPLGAAWTNSVSHSPLASLVGGAFNLFGSRKSKSATGGGHGSSGSWGTPVQINIDGKKVADAVVPHMDRALSAPQTGISDFDSRLTAQPAGGVSW